MEEKNFAGNYVKKNRREIKNFLDVLYLTAEVVESFVSTKRSGVKGNDKTRLAFEMLKYVAEVSGVSDAIQVKINDLSNNYPEFEALISTVITISKNRKLLQKTVMLCCFKK